MTLLFPPCMCRVCVSHAKLCLLPQLLPSVANGKLRYGENSTFLTNAPAADLWFGSKGGGRIWVVTEMDLVRELHRHSKRATESHPIVSYPPLFLKLSPQNCFPCQAGERAAGFGAARADPKTEAARGVSAGYGRRRHPGDQRERLDFE